MSATVDLTESQITKVVGDFLSLIVPAEVFVGQANWVPEPAADDFVILWPTFRGRMAYNIDTWQFIDAPTVAAAETDAKVIFQIDVHGPNSPGNAQIIATLWQDDFAVMYFDSEGYPIRPLYIDDAQQIPFLNGESQTEMRWTMKGALQGNFTISTPQQFANTLAIGLINVDATYPPEP